MICRLGIVNDQLNEKALVLDIDDILMIIKSDYEKAYFVTGALIIVIIIFLRYLIIFAVFGNLSCVKIFNRFREKTITKFP